ncbi:MAG: insulinase family protein, partial [Candidatus Eremiobacteraeota bacterium]|nr:insulinase family protein [Candidatus Eremiobacteraeota bacterium]
MSRVRLPAACFLMAVLALCCGDRAAAVSSDVTQATLDNGLRVVIVRDPLAPVVTTEMNYLVGSVDEPDSAPGLAHAQEHMMFRDNPQMTGDQLAVITSAMGGKINGDTQETVTQYIFTVPKEDVDVALHIESQRMRGVNDSDDQWAAERGAIEQEVALRRSSALYRARAEALLKVFAGTPYSHDALGTAASFENITGLTLRTFYQLWYAPNNAILVIAGDVDPQAVMAQVQQLFGPIPRVSLPRHADFRLDPLTASTITQPSDLPFSMAFVAYRLPGVDDKDYEAGRVLGDALANARSEFAQLEPRGKALTSAFIHDPLPKASLGVAFAAISPNGDLKATAEQLQAIGDAYASNGVPPDLVDAAKRKELLAAQSAYGSIPDLAQLWSQVLAVERRASPDDDVAALQAVTVADVDRVAKQYLNRTTAVVAMLQHSPEVEPMMGQEGGGLTESFARDPGARVTLPSWSQKVLSTLTPGTSSLSPSDQRLPNGVRLVVQRESGVDPMIYVSGEVKQNENLEAAPGKEGVSLLLDEVLPYGTQSLDHVAFLKALDDAGATFDGGSKFTMQVPGSSFDQGIALLADDLQHPALPDAAFARLHAEMVSVFGPYISRKGQTGQQILMAHLYPAGDPMQRVPTMQSLTSLTNADVRAYYRKAFRPDVTTIVVVGDIAPETARAAVDKAFGSWQASGPRPRVDAPPVPPNKGFRGVYYSNSLQDTVLEEETLGVTRSSQDFYPLQVGNYVFGRMGFTARLFQDLRIDRGLVYYVDGEPEFSGGRAT